MGWGGCGKDWGGGDWSGCGGQDWGQSWGGGGKGFGGCDGGKGFGKGCGGPGMGKGGYGMKGGGCGGNWGGCGVWQPMFNPMMMKGFGKSGLRTFENDRKVFVGGMPPNNCSKEINMKLKDRAHGWDLSCFCGSHTCEALATTSKKGGDLKRKGKYH